MPIVASLANASAGGFGLNKTTRTKLPYMWVAAGNNGVLYTSTSTTASSWTSRTSSFGTSWIANIASDGYMFVAVGDAGKLATSTDGITWTQRTSSFGSGTIFGVAYGTDGYWVAVGGAGKLATSTNGIDWTQRTSGTSYEIYTVAYGNGLWVTAPDGAMTATNPTSTWTSRTMTTPGFYGDSLYYDTYNGVWVCGGKANTATGAISYSTNGTTWTTANIPNVSGSILASYAFVGGTAANTIVMAYSRDTVYIDIATSGNGSTWTDRTPANTGNGKTPQAAAVDDNGFMVILSSDGTLQSSSNGSTWTNRGLIHADADYAIIHSSGLPSSRT